MTHPDTPTLGEVMRRLDDVVRRITEMSQQLQDANRQAERTFVRSDVFEARQALDTAQMVGLEGEVHSVNKRLDDFENRRRTDRALVFSALIAPLVILLISAAVLAR